MAEITTIIGFIQDIGFVGILIILAIPKLRQRIFGMNGYDIMKDEIKKVGQRLTDHMDEEEEEMRDLRKDINCIKSDVSYIKGKLSNKDEN